MGVKDLWQLLSPIGRRVSIESLEGKTLAIDASIWITQFIKAMRDEEGKMMKNAHLIGTVRRVLRLLFHRIRPLFVFDGATPELKLRVVQARRKGREMQEESKRVAAQRLLRAQLRLHAQEHGIRNSSTAPTTGSFVSSFRKRENRQGSDMDEDLALTAKSTEGPLAPNSADAMDDVEWQDGYENLKGKQLTAADGDGAQGSCEEAEWLLPDNADDLSADVLSSLPAHIRKSLVEDARRRQRNASRAHYLPVAGNPALYSQTQLSNFLSSSKLNKKFIEAQKSAEDPLQGSRIAADGGRKYQYLSLAARTSDLVIQQDAAEVAAAPEAAAEAESADDDENYWESFSPDPVQSDAVSVAHARSADTCMTVDAVVGKAVINEVMWEEEVGPPAGPVTTLSAKVKADKASSPRSVGASVAAIEAARSGPAASYFNLADSSDEGASDVAWESGSEAGDALGGDSAEETARSEENANSELVISEDTEGDTDGTLRHAVCTVTRTSSTRVDGAAERYGTEEFRACSVSAEAANQAILTASSMADWAGRAVRRALKDHLQRPLAATDASETREVPPPGASPAADNSLAQSPRAVESAAPSQPESEIEAGQVATNIEKIAKNPAVEVDGAHTGLSEGQGAGLPAGWIDDPIDMAEARRQFNRAMRDSESLSEELKEEVIQLLQAMNLPYLVAPFEAEAQCAVLEQLGLVDGVVTEDSDALLFGAATVYKNIFSDKKYVEVYLAEDARREMGLWREDMVAFAYFLGSDYAEGVNGVGIVNAVEIIRAFPMRAQTSDSSSSSSSTGEARPGDDVAEGPLRGLRKFKEWLHGYDFEGEFFGREGKAQKITPDEHKLLTEFTERHKGARSRWTVPDSFPDPRVARAYLRPAASYNADRFAWQQAPDSATLKAFCSERLGWTAQQIDAAVDPVLQRCSQRTIQTRIDAHFLTYQSDTRFAKIASDRLRDAVVVQVAGKRSSLSLSGNTTQRKGLKKKKQQQDDA